MADPFFNGGGFLGGNTPGTEQNINMNQERRARAIAAYKNNIAVEDLHVTEHWEWAEPVNAPVLGEDGEEMTLERRREIMAGKRTAVENGDLAKDVDYREAFEDDIEQERLGKSAEENREGIRVVRPIQDDAPKPENAMAECLYTSGHDAVIDPTTLSDQTRLAMKSVIDASLERRCRVHAVCMSPETQKLLMTMLKVDSMDRYWGADVSLNTKLGNVIRFDANPYYEETVDKYSVIFIHRNMYTMWGVDPAAETDILPTLMETPDGTPRDESD